MLATGCPSSRSPDPSDRADADPGGRPDAPSWDGPGADPRVYWPRTVYLVLPDRFANGDPSNDGRGAAGCFDPAAPLRFHGGDLAGLAAHRAYLDELGVGVVWATPLARQVGRAGDQCGYHGYWADLAEPADPITDALEPRLGSAADLDRTLDELAGGDILYVLDVVVNHTGHGARVVATHPDWFHPGQGCNSEWTCPLSGLPDFKQEQPAVAAYVTDTTTAWLRRFAVAGLRMDTAKHVPTDYFARAFLPAARAIRPGLFAVAEVFTDGDMAQFAKYLDAGFDSVFHFPLRRALVNTFARGGSVDEVLAVVHNSFGALGADRARFLTTFLDNHDTPRFLSEASPGVPDGELAARYRLALAALFTLPGIPQLYYGDELGAVGTYPDNRRDMPAWAFDPASRGGARPGYVGDPAATFALTRRLIALRRDHAALHAGGFAELWRHNGGPTNLLAYFRSSGTDRAVAVVHAGATPSGPMRLPFRTNPAITEVDRDAWPDGTQLHELLGLGAPATATVIDGQIRIDLPARTPALYVATP